MNLPDNPELARAILTEIEKKRREESYIRYWRPFDYEQKVFDKFTEDIKVLVVAGGNRCLAGSTVIPTLAGPRTIQDIQPGELVYAIDGSPVKVLEKFSNGERQVYRWHGQKRQTHIWLDATEDHKVMQASGNNFEPALRPLDFLKTGKQKYLVRSDGIELGEQQEPLALLIGLLLGDGYIAGKDTQWTCAEPDLVEELRPYIESFGFVLSSRGIQHQIRDFTVLGDIPDSLAVTDYAGRKIRHRLRIRLQELGLLGTRSGNKFIPAEVWNWRKEDVAQLIGGLIATDGSVWKSGYGAWECSYSSKSLELVENLKKLLADVFGIYGSTIKKSKLDQYSISYGTQQALERFAELPIPGRKLGLLKQATCKKNSKNTLVPFAGYEDLGSQETFDILIEHPSHVFNVQHNLQVSNSGKTICGAALTMAWALGKDYFKGDPAWDWVKNLPIPDRDNKNIWMVGLDYKVLQRVIWNEKLIQGKEYPGFLPKDGIVDKILERDMQIELKNGTSLTGMSADSGREKFQSASVDLIWLDEECDVEIFDECYMRTVDCGGKIVVTVTPLIDISSGVKTPWIYNLWEEAKNGRKDVAFVNLSVLDNPTVPADEKKKLLEKYKGHPEERARLFGEFVRRTGLVYPNWQRSIHLKRTNPPPDWYTVVSIDPAATGPTAALWGRVDPSGNIHLYREYLESDLPVSEHVANIKVRNRGDKVDLWLIDPTWARQRTAENHKTGQQLYREHGLPVRLADVGEDFGRLAFWEYLQSTVLGPESRNPKIWVDPTLHDFVDEIEHYIVDSYSSGPLKGMSKDRPRKRADDLINAAQYMAAMRPRGKMRLEPEYSEEYLRQQASRNSYF